MKILIITFIIIFTASGCSQDKIINTDHLDHLYEQIIVKEDTLGIIHIYAEYPDYHWIDDEDEGTACVDDAARAMIFYLEHYKLTNEEASLDKTKKLLNFLFYMQAENGFFYNFIWGDHTINKDFKTSEAIPNWWSWRALWAMTEADKYFRSEDPSLSKEIRPYILKLIHALSSWITKDEVYAEYAGLNLPAWLPYETASDQAAVILKGLVNYYETDKDSAVLDLMAILAKGIMKMQTGNKENPPYYAFLSWQNTWHAWGNSQADALISAGKILEDSTLINSALNEIKYFYPYLISQKYLSYFSISKDNGNLDFDKTNHFPQIAYGFRPMIFAALNAYEITKDTFYAELAGSIASWFLGNNSGEAVMYSGDTGRCFDGLLENGKVNMNSGAESTIEALLSFVKLENNVTAKAKISGFNKK